MKYEKTPDLSIKTKLVLGGIAVAGMFAVLHHGGRPSIEKLVNRPQIEVTVKPGDTAYGLVADKEPNDQSQEVTDQEINIVLAENKMQRGGTPMTENILRSAEFRKVVAKFPEDPLQAGEIIFLPKS